MMERVGAFLDTVYFGNSLLSYLTAVCLLLAGFLAVHLIVPRMAKRLKSLHGNVFGDFNEFLAELIEDIVFPLAYFVVVYMALKSLMFRADFERVLNYLLQGAFIFFGVKTAIAFIGYGFRIYLRKRGADAALLKSFHGFLMVVRVVVWAGAVIFFLDNLGFKVSALITGLGIGGVAVALAAQSIFKDLFSYFFIVFDRPFKVGDFLIIDDYLGSVEHIGLKTTRLRSLSGEVLIFPNSNLTDSRLRNYQLMQKRRIEFKFRVDYRTPLDTLREISPLVKGIIEHLGETAFDRANLASFDEYGLTYIVVYYVLSADYNKYMAIQEQLNFSIMEEFSRRNILFAYPGRLFISRGDAHGEKGQGTSSTVGHKEARSSL